MPAARPYGTALASAARSDSVRQLITESTGPKISSWATRMLLLTPRTTVGSTKNPCSRPSGAGLAAADGDLRPVVAGRRHVAEHPARGGSRR